jgi:hypothetical protein
MSSWFQNEISSDEAEEHSDAFAGFGSGTPFAVAVHMMIQQNTVDRPSRSRHPRAIDRLSQRIRSEYREMPGLNLTEAQARRLWSIDEPTCRLVFRTLVDQRFLKRTPSGTYIRRPS